MSPKDKLALGLGLFCAIFVLGLMVLPRSSFERYYEDLRRRKRFGMVKQLTIGVFVLSGPYYYDCLVGFENPALSSILGIAISLLALIVLTDIAAFAYRTCRPPSGGGCAANKSIPTAARAARAGVEASQTTRHRI